jgi:hypothetical protein
MGIAVIAMVNWLRPGGGYDRETGPIIGPEPPNWKPHEVEPWQREHERQSEQDPSSSD